MLFFNCLTALMDVLLPLFQRYAVDEFIEAGTLNGLWVFALCYLGAIMTQTLAVLGMGRNSMFIEMTVGRDMRRAAFTHLQTLSFSYYNVTPVGYILSRVMSDTMKIAGIIGWALPDVIWAVFYLTGALISMLLLNWRLALVVIVIVPLIALTTAYFQGRLLLWNRRVRKLNSRITGTFNEGITGAKTSKTLVIERDNTESFRRLTGEMYESGVKATRVRAVYVPLVLFLSTMAVALDRGPHRARHALSLHNLRRGHLRARAAGGGVYRRVHQHPGQHRARHRSARHRAAREGHARGR